MQEYHNDNVIKFEHSPVISKIISPNNEVGATGSLKTGAGFYEPDYTPTDLNTVFVSSSDGDDDTGDGSELNPVASLPKADELCIDNDIHNVLIQDSGKYVLPSFTFTALGMHKIYASKGNTPKIVPKVVSLDSLNSIKSETKFLAWDAFYGGAFEFTDEEVLLAYGTVNSYYIRKVSSDGTLGSFVTLAVGASAYPRGGIAITPNKYIIYAYYIGTNSYCGVLKSDLSQHVAGTLIMNGVFARALKGLSNGHVVLLGNNSNGLYMSIFVGETLEAVTPVAIKINSIDYTDPNAPRGFIIEGPSQIYICCGSKISEYTKSGAFVESYDMQTGSIITSAVMMYNGNIMLGLDTSGSYYTLCVSVFDCEEKEVIYTSDVIDSNGSPYKLLQTSQQPATLTRDGKIILAYHKQASTNANFEIKHIIVDESGNLIYMSPADFKLGALEKNVAVFGNNRYIFTYRLLSDSDIYYQIFKYETLSSKSETNIELHGITLSSEDDDFMSELIMIVSSDIKMRWCSVVNSESRHYWVKTCAIIGSGDCDIENSLFDNIDAGIATAGEVLISKCQFISVKKDYAIKVTGATGLSEIKNCDFVSVYGGIRAISNGIITIKNSIFLRAALAAIHADNNIPFDHSTVFGPVIGATPGLWVFNINPMYINDGSVNPSLRNLNLRNRVLGYAVDSAALYLGDDGKNAGSLDIEYTGDDTSWTEILVDKDKQGITVKYIPIGEVKTERKDGSISSYKDSFSEQVIIHWRAISNSDFDKLMIMLKSASPRIRVYFQPITNPLLFDEYSIVYEPVAGSPKDSVALSRTGKAGVEITLQRASE